MSDSLGNRDDLRSFFGAPIDLAVQCVKNEIDDYHRRFIEMSPFICLATSDASGQPYVSPKGDAPGFVTALDDRSLLIPDRSGNNKVESFSSIVENPKVSVIFFVPGLPETLRVLGTASLTTDATMLQHGRARNALPKVATRIDIEKIYFHCGKALVRSKLWHEDTRVGRNEFPSFGEVLKQQCALEMSVDETDGIVNDLYTNHLT